MIKEEEKKQKKKKWDGNIEKAKVRYLRPGFISCEKNEIEK